MLELSQSTAWQEIWQPRLESKVKHAWVDPRESTDEKDFFHKYCMAWAMAMAANEQLEFVEQMRGQRDALLAKKEGKTVNKFKIGG